MYKNNLAVRTTTHAGTDPGEAVVPHKTYEGNFIHHDLVHFGKHHINTNTEYVFGHVRIVSFVYDTTILGHSVVHCFVTAVLWIIFYLTYSCKADMKLGYQTILKSHPLTLQAGSNLTARISGPYLHFVDFKASVFGELLGATSCIKLSYFLTKMPRGTLYLRHRNCRRCGNKRSFAKHFLLKFLNLDFHQWRLLEALAIPLLKDMFQLFGLASACGFVSFTDKPYPAADCSEINKST